MTDLIFANVRENRRNHENVSYSQESDDRCLNRAWIVVNDVVCVLDNHRVSAVYR